MKKNGLLGKITFWLIFLALIFGGDIVQFIKKYSDYGSTDDESIIIVGLVFLGPILLLVLFQFLQNFLKNFKDSYKNNFGANTHHNITKPEGSFYGESHVNEFQSVTGEKVNPYTLNGD